VLGDGGVADDDEVPWPCGEAVHGPFLSEPLEERQEERAAEEVLHVVELGGRDGDPRVVGAAPADRARERREPVRTRPRGGRRGLVVPAPIAAAPTPRRGKTDAGAGAVRRRTSRPRRRRRGGGGEGGGGHRACRPMPPARVWNRRIGIAEVGRGGRRRVPGDFWGVGSTGAGAAVEWKGMWWGPRGSGRPELLSGHAERVSF
jgi:hypothetical protein